MRQQVLLAISIVSFVLMIDGSDGARAFTSKECNSIHNSCVQNCDRYSPDGSTDIWKACRQNCVNKTTECIHTGKYGGKSGAASTMGPGEETKKPQKGMIGVAPPPAGLLGESTTSGGQGPGAARAGAIRKDATPASPGGASGPAMGTR
jgi:hypothetical protein